MKLQLYRTFLPRDPNPDKPRLAGAGRQSPASYFFDKVRGTKICHPGSVTNCFWMRDGGRLEGTKNYKNRSKYCFTV